MSLRKYLNLLFMLMLVLAVACGGGKEVVEEEDLGEDDGALQTSDTSATAAGTAATPAGGGAPAVADAATIAGAVKFEAAAAPKMPNLQMGADPFCASQHPTPVPDEEVVVG